MAGVEMKINVAVDGAPKVDALAQSLDSTAQAATGAGGAAAQAATGMEKLATTEGAAAKEAQALGSAASSAGSGMGQANAQAQGFTATSGKLRDGMQSVSTQLANARTELLQLVGVGAGLQGVKDISALADSYKNLEARIKLVTGEGKAFDTAFAGVFDVAKRTNSAVDETGTLFAKLAEAGKAIGVSNGEALKITETINQAIQLSGASADASKASITQLIQGLQSGVLRGDEFNSVMEQSPRLAKALADGLGVSTGALRKQAEEGKLTSAVVIKALQGQAQAIETEFGKLPATVGRAMTNLTTEFTRYVGEADKAGGYTAKLAGGIDLLAGNLTTVANTMLHVGQTLGAMKLLNMAQEWLTAGAAIKAHAESTTAATAATTQSTAAKTQNTAATTANTAATTANTQAQTASAAAIKGSSAVATTAGSSFGGLGSVVGAAGVAVKGLARAFAPLMALDIVLNAKSYGTAIGEWAARMAGAKDRSKELADAEKVAAAIAEENAAARKRQALATQEAADRAFGLTTASAALEAKFDELRTKGDSTSEAIGKIGKDFDLSKSQGIKDAAGVLDKLVATGKISATEFQKAWADALKGEDLGAFEVKARTALDGTTRGAERLAQVFDASVREAIRRTGLDFDVISGGMGQASRSAINDTDAIIKGLDGLKAKGVDTGLALQTAISKSIDTADSQKAIEAVRGQIESLRKVLGDKLTDGLLEQADEKARALGDAADKAKPGVNSLREAFRELGMKTPEEIKTVESKIADVTVELKKAAAQGLITGDQLAEGLAKAQQKTDEIKPGINSVAEAMQRLGVTSGVELKRMAAESESAYFKLKNGATTTASEINQAFKKFAEEQIAANDGVATEWLKNEAAARGYSIAVDEAGKATVKLNESRKNSPQQSDQVAEGYGKEENALRQIAQASRDAEAAERSRAEAAAEAERKRLNMDKEGFTTDSSGNRIAMGGDLSTLTGIAAFLQAAGVDDEAEARRIAKEFANEKGEIQYLNNAGQIKYGGRSSTLSQEVLKAAERYTFSDKNMKSSSIPAQTQTININLNGKSTAVTVATANDAAALRKVLEDLADAAGRS